MELMENHLELCTVCNDVYTAIHTEIEPGLKIYVCEDCVEAARYNFIWLCLHCGRAYLRPKKIFVNDMNEALIKAYKLCGESKVIQVIEMCEKCDPNGTERYMKIPITNMEC